MTYTLGKVLIVPGAEEPASALHAVKKNNCDNEGVKPSTLLTLEKATLKVVDDELAQLRSALLHGGTKLAAEEAVGLWVRDLFNGQTTLVGGLRKGVQGVRRQSRVVVGFPGKFGVDEDVSSHPKLQHTLQENVLLPC